MAVQEEEEWEYNQDVFKKKLEKMDEAKKQEVEEQARIKESEKLKVI